MHKRDYNGKSCYEMGLEFYSEENDGNGSSEEKKDEIEEDGK